jgi:hypothetical protein
VKIISGKLEGLLLETLALSECNIELEFYHLQNNNKENFTALKSFIYWLHI